MNSVEKSIGIKTSTYRVTEKHQWISKKNAKKSFFKM